MSVSPYLTFDGRCQEAFQFYEKVLGARIEMMYRFEGTPAEHMAPPEWRDKIMHALLAVGDKFLMGSDAPPDRYKPMQGFAVSLQVDDPAEAERMFNALAEGGSVTMPIAETFWAERFGMVTDRFGTPWMVNCEKAG